MAGRSTASTARTTSSARKGRSTTSASRSTKGRSRRTISSGPPRSTGSSSIDASGITAEERKRLSRPFDRATWARATELAAQYKVVIETNDAGTGYVGYTIEMPFTFGEGSTSAACFRDTLQAAALGIATLLESNQRPPSPTREGKREQQLNVRLSSDEKLRLEAAAERDGFRSVSDFVRSAALKAS
jgi:predicted RNase H-like HicB family nuclease